MSLLYQWTGNVVRGEPIVVEDRTYTRDYTFVGDVSVGIQTVLDAPALPHDVYNLSGSPTSLEQVVNALTELQPSLQVIDAKGEGTLALAQAPLRDSSRLMADLGYAPSHDILAGLSAYLKWREKSGFTD
jgi:nucleoside-diphosphate-sugar epimerase